MEEHVVYEERQPLALWVHLLLGGIVAFTGLLALLDPPPGWEGDPVRALWVVGPVAAFVALFEYVVGHVVVGLTSRAVVVAMGPARWIRRRIPWTEVEAAEAVTYSPIAEFGGWGIRWAWPRAKGKTAWTGRGDRAVVLRLKDGRRVYLGSDDPERLLARMREVAGPRLA